MPPNSSQPICAASVSTPRCGRPKVIRSWSENPATARVRKRTKSGPPHVLFYGHYDVQPVDPLDLWATPPFEPRIDTLPDGRKIIVARGACDDKGQAMTFIEACRAYKAVTGKLPLPITMMIEGEEECGSKNLFGFVRDNADEFKLDLALVCDTAMWDQKTPAITIVAARHWSTRRSGSPAPTATCTPACSAVRRKIPIRVLSKILAAMHDDNGRVTIPGFYDGVQELPPDIKAELAALNLTAEQFLGQVGLKEPAGEKDRMLIEQITTRPTAEINGISRRLHRRGRENRDAGQGDGQGVVPSGGRSGPGEDPRWLPRLRQSAASGRLHGRIRQFRRRPRAPTAVRQSGARQDARRRSRPSGARPR